MYMIHYYLQKGKSLEELLNLSTLEKIFYMKSMEISIEEEAEKYKALFGDSK